MPTGSRRAFLRVAGGAAATAAALVGSAGRVGAQAGGAGRDGDRAGATAAASGAMSSIPFYGQHQAGMVKSTHVV